MTSYLIMDHLPRNHLIGSLISFKQLKVDKINENKLPIGTRLQIPVFLPKCMKVLGYQMLELNT